MICFSDKKRKKFWSYIKSYISYLENPDDMETLLVLTNNLE